MVFFDYKISFDNVVIEELWNAMILFEILQKFDCLVKICSDKTIFKVYFL